MMTYVYTWSQEGASSRTIRPHLVSTDFFEVYKDAIKNCEETYDDCEGGRGADIEIYRMKLGEKFNPRGNTVEIDVWFPRNDRDNYVIVRETLFYESKAK